MKDARQNEPTFWQRKGHCHNQAERYRRIGRKRLAKPRVNAQIETP